MFAVIRLRGDVNVRKENKDTMELLSLYKKNHLALKPENDSVRFMLKKVESFVTFGEINQPTLARLLEKRGRLVGDKHLDNAFLKKHSCSSFEDLAKRIADKKLSLEQLGVKKVFRLHAPRKGFERQGIKKMFSMGGALGYRANAINELIERMM